jgi:hypothetical protein
VVKQNSQNFRELLMVKVPKAFGASDVDTKLLQQIRETKNIFDLGKSHLMETVTNIVARIFKARMGVSATSAVLDWYETLKPTTLEYVFPNCENRILSLIKEGETCEDTFLEKLCKTVTGLRLNDWNYSTIGNFEEGLKELKDSIDCYNSKDKNDMDENFSCKVILNRNGEEVVKVFEKSELSNVAKLLYNDVSGAIEELGQSISEREKRQVLVDILLEMCD